MYLLGIDIGSSSIKVALVDADSQQALAVSQFPKTEMKMLSHEIGWAEQAPKDWWTYVCQGTQDLIAKTSINPSEIKAIGISYQMHGLVCIDKDQNAIRPSIIWCDSRAVSSGQQAFENLGDSFCFDHYLNSPGNFTGSKLKWVKENEPQLFEKVDKILLPGDYIAMKMTGLACSTISGLSEGILWDFKNAAVADNLLKEFGISESVIPEIRDTFSEQGTLIATAAEELGLTSGIPISYRAGDQPNNALSLGVFNPGDVAGTGGTSGVVYAVTDKLIADKKNRVNSFAHVNYSIEDPRVGVLLCINGAGSMYAWTRNNIASSETSYESLEDEASKIPIGADDLMIFPFGNGSERMFQNKNLGSQVQNLHFNKHSKAHMYRASLEGIAFAFVYGIEAMNEMGIDTSNLKVGNDNLFRSNIFSQTISNITNAPIEIVETTGAIGAALGAGIGIGYYSEMKDAFQHLTVEQTITPQSNNDAHVEAYGNWKKSLTKFL